MSIHLKGIPIEERWMVIFLFEVMLMQNKG